MAISLSPNSGSTAGHTAVTVTGTNLLTTSRVLFGGNPATLGAITATTVAVTSPAGSGAVPVTLTTSGGTSLPVTYYYVPSPILLGLSSGCGSTAGGDAVTITGQNLGSADRVTFGATNVDAPFTAQSAGSVTLDTPAHAVGAVAVSVRTPAGTVDGLSFTYCAVQDDANVTITPSSGSTLGNDVVSISDVTDGGFSCIQSVTVGGVSVLGFFPISDTSIDVLTPPGTAGAQDVVITTCSGAATVTGGFTYIPPP